MFSLQVLGGLALRGDTSELPASATQRRRLALLALLAAAGGRGLTRERLGGLLWPESSPERARHTLEQLLYASRRDLGREAFLADAGALRLNPEVIQTDLAAFDAAVAAGDPERAVALYAGPFLDGVYLDGAPELEQWVERERTQLADRYADALEAVAQARTEAGDFRGAVEAWRLRAAQDPFSARGAVGLMRALEASGDRAAAIRHADVHAALLREELGAEPDPEVVKLAELLRREPTPRKPPPSGAARAPRDLPAIRASGSRDVAPVGRTPPARFGSRPLRVAVACAAVLVLGTGVWLLYRGDGQSASAASPGMAASASVAVLPFDDMSAEGTDEYFGDGLTEELIHALSQVNGLRVVARTSAFSFKGKNTDVREIGDALDVASVVEGSVRRAGNRVRINVQLIDARTGYHLWSETYDREMSDIFAVQEEIARAVARRLRPGGATSPMASAGAPPTNVEAYNLVLRGRYLWSQRNPDAVYRSIALFQGAIREDPSYAPAYMGLAEAYNLLVDSGWNRQDSEQLIRDAEDAARTAVRLDTGYADAYVALGHLRMHRRDQAGAERNFRRALELQPGNALGHQYLGVLLAHQGRFDSAVEEMRLAQELDPLSVGIHGAHGLVLYLARRYGDAEQHLRNLIAMDSTRGGPHLRLGLVLVEMGRYDEAVREIQTAIPLPGGGPATGVPALGYAYARAGRRAEAERIAAEVQRRLPDKEFSAYYAVALLGALGETDRAFVLLDQMAADPGSPLVGVAVNPAMDPLRSDARFARLLEQAGHGT